MKLASSNCRLGIDSRQTRQTVDPPTCRYSRTSRDHDWEPQDLAVDYVCDFLNRDGCEIQSRNPDSRIFPSLFYCRDDVQSFVGIFSARFPRTPTPQLDQLHQIAQKQEVQKLCASDYCE